MAELVIRGGTAEELADSLDFLRRLNERWCAKDWEWMRAHYADDAELFPPPGWPEASGAKTRDEVIARWLDVTDPVDDMEIEVLSFEHVGEGRGGGDVAVIEFTWRGRASSSRLPIAMTMFQVARRHGELLDHQAHFLEREEARRHAEALLERG
jgi:hypothetical protein